MGLVEKPTISEIQVTFAYPAYLGKTKDTFSQKKGDLEAPQYTVAELAVRPTVPIAKGLVEIGGAAVRAAAWTDRHPGGEVAAVERRDVSRSTSSTAWSTGPRSAGEPRPRAGRSAADGRAAQAGPQLDGLPRGGVAVTIRAGDDHMLWPGPAGNEGQEEPKGDEAAGRERPGRPRPTIKRPSAQATRRRSSL